MEGPRSAMLSLYLSFEFIHSIPLVLSFSRGFAINQILWGQICEKSFIYLEGNVPSFGNHFSGLFVPATPSSLSRTLEGLLELTQCPSRASDLPYVLLRELQRSKDTVRCVTLCAKAPRHCQEQLIHTLIVRLFKTHFFLLFQKIEGPKNFQLVCSM